MIFTQSENVVLFEIDQVVVKNTEELLVKSSSDSEAYSSPGPKMTTFDDDLPNHFDMGTPTITCKRGYNEGHSYNLNNLVKTLLKNSKLGERKSTRSDGNCFFEAIRGEAVTITSTRSNMSLNLINIVRKNIFIKAEKWYEIRSKVIDKNSSSTIKNINANIDTWINNNLVDICQVLNDSDENAIPLQKFYLDKSVNGFMDVTPKMKFKLYCQIMSKNRGKFTWADFDLLCHIQFSDKIIITLYEDMNDAIFIYYPKYYSEGFLNKQWLANGDNYRVIIKLNDHFDYLVPSMHFIHGVSAIAHLPLVDRMEINLTNDSELANNDKDRQEQHGTAQMVADFQGMVRVTNSEVEREQINESPLAQPSHSNEYQAINESISITEVLAKENVI